MNATMTESDRATSTPPRFATLDLAGLKPRDIAGAARSVRPIIDYVLPGLVSESIAVMVGPGGVSKSMLALQTAAVVATGVDHWHLWTDGKAPIVRGRVAVFNIEDPGVILDMRVHDIAASVGAFTRDAFIEGFHEGVSLWPLVGRGFAFGEKAARTGRIRPTEWIEWMSEQLSGVRLAIVDTFIRGLDGLDENSSTEVAPVLAMLEIVARRTGCAFLILHHTNKASSGSGQGGGQQAARGSSAITDNARWQTNISTMTEGEAHARGMIDARKRWVQVELSKCNYGPPLESRWLHRGEGGVLDGRLQLAPLTPGKPKAGKVQAIAGPAAPFTDRRRLPPPVPDAVEFVMPAGL